MDNLLIGMIADDMVTKFFKGKTTIAKIITDLNGYMNVKDQSEYIQNMIPACFKLQVLGVMLQAKDMENNKEAILEISKEVAMISETLAKLGGVK